MMKQLHLLLLFSLSVSASIAQPQFAPDSAFQLIIEKIYDPADTSGVPGYCNSKDFFIMTDCLSDFILKDANYLYYRIVDCTADSIIISLPGDHDPLIKISPKDVVSLSTITHCYVDGKLGWQPNEFHSNEYRFSLMKNLKREMFSRRKICWDEECNPTYTGYLCCKTNTKCRFIFKRGETYYVYGENDQETVPLNIHN